MPANLRELLIQRAARLQGRPGLTSADWGTLSYAQFRNRVEGVALGLMATEPPPGSAIFCATGGPWDWASELAAACCGLSWGEAGQPIAPEILGGPRFNDENGRGPYHEREHGVAEGTLFSLTLDHGAMMLRLQRMNKTLGWDHDSEVRLPMARYGSKELRAALWCSLYGGSHAILEAKTGAWDSTPFKQFWDQAN